MKPRYYYLKNYQVGGKKERKNKNKKIIALIQVTQYLTKNSSREKKENEGDKIFKELM